MKTIYSCGCCLSNPGDGGWAIYLKHNNKDYKIYGYGGFTTTNEMELKSAIIASQCIDEGESSIVITDSQYIIKGIGEWINGWKKNGWNTSSKKPVKHQNLWMELDKLNSNRQIQWQYVKSNSGDSINEMTKQLAITGATGQSNESLKFKILNDILNKNNIKNDEIDDFINLNIYDLVIFKDNTYIIVDEIKNDSEELGYLIINPNESVYINNKNKLQKSENNEKLKYKLLEYYKDKNKEIYYQCKESCHHNIVEARDSAVCEYCGDGFGWHCSESPDHVCHYYSQDGKVELIDGSYIDIPIEHDDSYETDDYCIYCGDPE